MWDVRLLKKGLEFKFSPGIHATAHMLSAVANGALGWQEVGNIQTSCAGPKLFRVLTELLPPSTRYIR